MFPGTVALPCSRNNGTQKTCSHEHNYSALPIKIQLRVFCLFAFLFCFLLWFSMSRGISHHSSTILYSSHGMCNAVWVRYKIADEWQILGWTSCSHWFSFHWQSVCLFDFTWHPLQRSTDFETNTENAMLFINLLGKIYVCHFICHWVYSVSIFNAFFVFFYYRSFYYAVHNIRCKILTQKYFLTDRFPWSLDTKLKKCYPWNLKFLGLIV